MSRTKSKLPIISFKYRAYPEPDVAERLDTALDACRWIYNQLLEEMAAAKKAGTPMRASETQARIVTLKQENPWLNDAVYSKAAQMVNNTIWANITALSEARKRGRKTGKLRFKGAFRYRTLNYNQSGFKIDREAGIVTLSKIGDVPFDQYRPFFGTVKGVLITRAADGWYVILQAQQDPTTTRRRTGDRCVGIDVGLASFAVDTDGTVIENPSFYESALPRIRLTSRSVSRKVYGSKNWQKAKNRLNVVHDHIRNQRNDYLHKLSRWYVENYGSICVEDLDTKKLKEKGRNTTRHRRIADASWGRFFFYLSYKAASAGTRFIQVDSRYTTQICASCGSIVKKPLSERTHRCPYCGFVADRDYNAAINILRSGMEQPFEPVEPVPLRHITVTQVLSMTQEAPPFTAG